MINYFPKYFSSRAIGLYLALLLIIPVVFQHPMNWYWWLFGIVEVAGFFYFSNALTKSWRTLRAETFERKLFLSALGIRIAYVLFSYFFYYTLTGTPFEPQAADVKWYNDMGRFGADLIWGVESDWDEFFKWADLSDTGYPLYLSILYAISGKSILFVRLIKALISAFTVILIYRLASRNFGEETGRIAAVFCLLMPNLIYYCGLHLKETEMLFLTVCFIERTDALFRSRKLKFGNILLISLIGICTYFFRAVLCIVLFLTVLTSLVLGSKKIKKGGKVAISGLLVVCMIIAGFLQIGTEQFDVGDYQNVQDQQNANMEWRSERKGGNSYAKYASASIFAPLIFTIPFPTMVNIEGQPNQQMIHGGNFVKNITSFFTILALFMLLFSGEWRDNIVPIAFTCGYLIVIAFSSFAQSERFHIPALPFELMLAAYGISRMKGKHKQLFTFWLIFIFVVNIGWTWFKLRGRGMI